MKVLHVNDCAGVAKNLIRGLKMLGVEAEHYQPSVGTYRAGKITRLSLPVKRTIESVWLSHYFRKHDIDLVHVHYARFAYMTLLTGLPYVLHIHGSDLRVDLTRPGLRELTHIAIRKAKQVYYVSPDLENALKEIRKDVIFLPNPINIEEFHPFKQDRKNPYGKRIFSISKLDRMKGVKHILYVIEKLLNKIPDIEIFIFNFGNESKQANVFFNKYINDHRVNPISRISHSDMPEIINSATLILGHQSKDFGSLTVSELEAMACAKPVVCCFTYPRAYPMPPPVLVSHTPDEAYDHVLRLLNDDDYTNDIGIASNNWVTKYHDINVITEQLRDLYLKIT